MIQRRVYAIMDMVLTKVVSVNSALIIRQQTLKQENVSLVLKIRLVFTDIFV